MIEPTLTYHHRDKTPGTMEFPEGITMIDGLGRSVKYVPEVVATPTYKFKPGDLVRVKSDYTGPEPWRGAAGVVKNVNDDGTLVSFGRQIEGVQDARRFKHKTDALEAACWPMTPDVPKFHVGQIVEVAGALFNRRGWHGVVVSTKNEGVVVEFGRELLGVAGQPSATQYSYSSSSSLKVVREVTHD